MAIWFIPFLILPFLGAIFYLFLRQKWSYWSRLGIRGPPPKLLNFGNVFLLQGRDPKEIELELAKQYGTVYGTYAGTKPTLTISDAELIKQVLVRDFSPYFVNRRSMPTYHEMVNNGLFFTDTAWKKLRTLTSTAFSTGKLAKNVPIMNLCIGKFIRYLDTLVQDSGLGVISDVRMTVIGMTIEVIAATSYGVETASNESNRSEENPFVTNALKVSHVNPLVALAYFAMPKWVNQLLRIEHVFNVDSVRFFTETSRALLKKRKSKQIGKDQKPNDLVQLLVDASVDLSEINSSANYVKLTASSDQDFNQNSTLGKPKATLTDSEVLGATTGTFVAGFDTTALNISCCLYELSLQPDLQERLYSDLKALNGLDVNSDEYFDIVMNRIPLLEAVIKESLRKYPPLARLERRVGFEGYKLGGIPLQKDQLVEISTFAVHFNPDYYPKPESFNPERFLPENRHLLVPYTFLPFGDGPRNCLGIRYAYLEMKLCLSQLLRGFKFSRNGKTPNKLHFEPFKFAISPQVISLDIEKRV